MPAVPHVTELVHPFEKLSNFRDVGGCHTADGHRLRTGILYRSEELSRLTRQDQIKFQALGIRLICDLRSPEESRKRQARLSQTDMADLTMVNIPLHQTTSQDGSRRRILGFVFGKSGGEQFMDFSRTYYEQLAFGQAGPLREIICRLAQERNLPALIHCTAGKDRTGFVVALIQLLVGVPYPVVMQDYLRTNDYFTLRLAGFIRMVRTLTLGQVSAERLKQILMAHPESLDTVYQEILKRHGSVECYLREACGIGNETLQQLKQRLLA
ncbi:tyrosine-protein phosphatase [Undibacterium sp. CY18W]|uniref:Tyrosine-protein phosphatase n=1 Tax=Undibacterium hunanense TaxID=2762292 RepID=A0ABR6ZMA0_9BURK|nr:tyrosine-protein phosphatase [Undibacterium hunanense]MBC3916530.1 tyrosine-protein phosphatase [Undibacterium hunanense]